MSEPLIPDNLPQESLPTVSILDRIKYLMFVMRLNQTQFAKRIGMNSANLSKALSGKSSINESLINRIVADLGISKMWLQTGQGVPFEKQRYMKEMGVDTNQESLNQIAYYEVELRAGTQPLAEIFATVKPSAYLTIPGLSPRCAVVKVQGESMQPTVRPGALVAISQVMGDTPIMWGQIYVVETPTLRSIKYLRKSSNPDKVILHSENPQFDDVEISRSDITHLYLVEAILHFTKF